MLTAAEVEQKTFSTALRGYDLDEVDDFLDEVVATIRELSEQLDAAQTGRATAPVAITPAPELEVMPEPEPVIEAPKPEIDESAIGRALLAAQNAADRLLEDAQSEATRIVHDARDEADSVSEERDAKQREAEAEIAALASRVASVRSELSVLAGEVAEKLDDMDAVIEGAEESDTWPDDTADAATVDTAIHAVADEPTDAPEDGDAAVSDESENGSDHLDEILSGVATDLQVGSDDEDSTSEEPDEDE